MKTLLSIFLVAIVIVSIAGCQKTAAEHNMSAAEHANM